MTTSTEPQINPENQNKPKSFSETGHAKNAANFGAIVTTIQTFGIIYNPSAIEIKIPNLITQKTNIDSAITAVRNSYSLNKNAINSRQLAYDMMNSLTTRAVEALSASGATTKEIKDAKSISHAIKGIRAKSIKSIANTTTTANIPADPTTDTQIDIAPASDIIIHSVSQLSFDNRVENFKKLLAYISGITKYSPNETDLKLTALNTYVNNLPTLNTAVNTTSSNLKNYRIARNKLLYTKVSGAFDIANQVIHYVKSVYGAKSPEYKMVLKFKLTDYSPK